MFTMPDALDWLYVEGGTYLTQGLRNRVSLIFSASQSVLQKQDIIFSLMDTSYLLSDPAERAELQTIIGVSLFLLSEYGEAEQWVERASEFYSSSGDSHRFAVSGAMLYLIMRMRCNFKGAFLQGRQARNIFLDKARQYEISKSTNLSQWYTETFNIVNRALIQKPEDVHEWLFEFSASQLNPPARQMRDRVYRSFEMQNQDQADQEARELLILTQGSRNITETGEALASRGTYEWIAGRRKEAVDYLRAALVHYLPNSHEYAMLTWMHGLVLYTFQNSRGDAITILQRGCDLIDRLRIGAMRQNQSDQMEWYLHLHAAMRTEIDSLTAQYP